MEPQRDHEDHGLPGPSLAPIGFAVGIATLLVGLVISWIVAGIGLVLAVAFGFLWVRELATGRDVSAEAAPPEGEGAPERPTGPAAPANELGPAMPHAAPGERFPRSRFLEGATLGLGGVIGGIVTAPVVGFAVLPPFLHQDHPEVDLGPIDNFPEGRYVVATFMTDPARGEVSRQTAFVRNNGLADGLPSFTVISNRCAHLGCPVQPGGPLFEDERQVVETESAEVTLIPTTPAGGFICPCHGGSYDTEGNRTAGPPVRALDRWTFAVKNGRLVLLENYSVGTVQGTGANARIRKYELHEPGEHVDGPEAWFYPVQPPR